MQEVGGVVLVHVGKGAGEGGGVDAVFVGGGHCCGGGCLVCVWFGGRVVLRWETLFLAGGRRGLMMLDGLEWKEGKER